MGRSGPPWARVRSERLRAGRAAAFGYAPTWEVTRPPPGRGFRPWVR